MGNYRNDIGADEVVRALTADPTLQFKEGTTRLYKGKCPSCGENELWTQKEKPWVVFCNRSTNCGWSSPTRELLPDLFADFAKRYPPTEKDRDATASAYLGIDRGFDLSKIRGWYEQGTYQKPNSNQFTPTVRFYLDRENGVWMERFIDGRFVKEIGRKAHFQGKYKGMAWTPPDFTLEKGERCYLVEGCIHATALHHMEEPKKAAACLSSKTFPDHFIDKHKGKGITWVIALDGDKSGRDGSKIFAKKLRKLKEKYEVITLPNNGMDWDDYHRNGSLTEKFLKDRLYYGKLFMSGDVHEKAYHMYCNRQYSNYTLEFRNALYFITVKRDVLDLELNPRKKDDADQEPEPIKLGSKKGEEIFFRNHFVDQISNINPRFLYMERDEIMDEQFYVFKIGYANNTPSEIIRLEGNHVADPAAFNKALLKKSSAGTYDGEAKQFKLMRDNWFSDKNMMRITSIPFVGYDHNTHAYVFQNAAYHNGREIPLNRNGYFQVGKAGIKTSLIGSQIVTDGEFSPTWLDDYSKAFHHQGMVLLAFWLGSFFAQQVRAMHKSYPFLEYTGDPGAGKTTGIEFLWACSGRDEHEGFDIMKASAAGRRRAMNQVSNLPVVIIESDRDDGQKDAKQKQFDFDMCKPFFNGRGTGTLGIAKRGNEVEESPFRAALIISQNAEVDGSDALLQRIVHVHVDKKHHGPGTRDIARFFEKQTSKTVGGFIRTALKNERKILQIYEEKFHYYEKLFSENEKIRNERIVKNHAQIAAFGAALEVIFPAWKQERQAKLADYIQKRAEVREQRIGHDHPIVEQFWESFHYLNTQHHNKEEDFLNHSNKSGEIAINMEQFREMCLRHGQELTELRILKKLLPQGKRHKLLCKGKAVNSRHLEKTVRCWIFKA